MAFTVDRPLQAWRRPWVLLNDLLREELSAERTREGMEGFREITGTELRLLLYA
jgi:hypothetical protein